MPIYTCDIDGEMMVTYILPLALYIDLVLSVTPSYLVVGEDGTGGSVLVTKSGYSFGDVNFNLRPLTYGEYISIASSGSLDLLFPLRPQAEASGQELCMQPAA